MNQAERHTQGIALIIAACACFAMLDAGSKFASSTVPLMLVIWIRYVMQMLFTGVVLLPRQGGRPFATRHPVLQVIRGLLLLLCSSLAFLSLMHMPIGEFTAIVMISPIMITLLSAIALKERVSMLRWLLVFGGFVGALIVIHPGGQPFNRATLLPLLLVVASTAFVTITGKLSRADAAGTTHFITGLVGLVVTTLLLPFFWRQPEDAFTWGLLIGIGLLGTIGHYFMILAYTRAPAASLTPYLYFQIAFATLGGWLVFAHVPDRISLLGIGIIAICGSAGLWVTAREKRPRA